MEGEVVTTREIAEFVGVETWRVQRLFTTGRLPEVRKFAGRRAIPRSMIPAIVSALQDRGWLPTEEAAAQ